MEPVQINNLFDYDPIDLIDQQILILDGIRLDQINDQDLEKFISKFIELPAVKFLQKSFPAAKKVSLTKWLRENRPKYYKKQIIGDVKNSELYKSRESFNLWEIPNDKVGNSFESSYLKIIQQWYIFIYESLTRSEIEFLFELNHFRRQSDKYPNKKMYGQLCNMINRFQTDLEMRDPIITPIEDKEMRKVIKLFWEGRPYFIPLGSLALTIGFLLIDHKIYLDLSFPEWKKETRNPPPKMIEAFEKGDDLLKEWGVYLGIIESEKVSTVTPADPLAMAAIEAPKKTITIDENQNDLTVKQWAIIYFYLDTAEALEGETQWKKLGYMIKNHHVQKSSHTIYKEIPKVRIQIMNENPEILRHLKKVATYLKPWSQKAWEYLKEDIEAIKESRRLD